MPPCPSDLWKCVMHLRVTQAASRPVRAEPGLQTIQSPGTELLELDCRLEELERATIQSPLDEEFDCRAQTETVGTIERAATIRALREREFIQTWEK